jgi:monoamine oxidase
MADMDYCVVGAEFAGPPGVLTEFGPALREPCGRIHWAGTESSTVMYGFIDGAVRSGERAATEVMARERTTVA